jgi:EAL domain-containing protein (putative c-di-GMP-specific phosphodiesterase class I)
MAHDPSFPPPAPPPVDLDGISPELTGWEDPAARLRASLSNDELQLFAQPVLRLSGKNDFPMAEILVRMREEENKMLPPGEFLPVFEHCRMMPALDRWVVRNVIENLSRPPAKGMTLTVNISSQTIEDMDFLPYVAGELVRREVDAKAVCFEIDEVDTLARPEAAAKFAATARRFGCRVLIDGFGQRSVTFNAFTALQASFVKVDGSIVRRILTTPSAASKLSAIVRVGSVMHIEVIAECVESQEILDKLRTLGVGYAQGFGIALPRAVDRRLNAATP